MLPLPPVANPNRTSFGRPCPSSALPQPLHLASWEPDTPPGALPIGLGLGTTRTLGPYPFRCQDPLKCGSVLKEYAKVSMPGLAMSRLGVGDLLLIWPAMPEPKPPPQPEAVSSPSANPKLKVFRFLFFSPDREQMRKPYPVPSQAHV